MQSEGRGRGDVESSKHLERKTKARELRRNTRLRASVSGCVGVLCVHVYVSVCARACVCVCAHAHLLPQWQCPGKASEKMAFTERQLDEVFCQNGPSGRTAGGRGVLGQRGPPAG